MSRCFPYPPPGYTLNRASNEALIESIKLQKEREKAISEKKKEKRREKDEKRKLKKEKAKGNTSEYDPCGGKSWANSKDGNLQKGRKVETEQLERSSITEEHGLAQNPSYSSDSTQNSNKRKRHASASNGTRVEGALTSNATRIQGNILRIRLPSQKNIRCDASCEKQQLSSTVARTEIPDTIASRAESDRTCSTSVPATTPSITRALPPLGPNKDLGQPCSQEILLSSQGDMPGSGHVSKRFKKMQRVVEKYTNMIQNFIPPNQHLLCSDDDVDQEWLFGRKHEQMQQIHSDDSSSIKSQTSCSTSASLWPTAQYLSDADIFALPYTVPF